MKKVLLSTVAIAAVGVVVVAPFVMDKIAEGEARRFERATVVQAAETALEKEKEKTAKARMAAEGKAMCAASKVAIKDHPVAGSDRGTKANLTLTSTVTADPGHFLLKSSAKYTHGKGKSDKLRVLDGETKPISELRGTPFVDDYVSSISHRVKVWDHDFYPTTARGHANVSVQQYPMECLKYFVQDGLSIIDELAS